MAKEKSIVVVATVEGDITDVLNSLTVADFPRKPNQIEIQLPEEHADQWLQVTVSDENQKLQALGWQWVNPSNPFKLPKGKSVVAPGDHLTIIRAGRPASIDYQPAIQIQL